MGLIDTFLSASQSFKTAMLSAFSRLKECLHAEQERISPASRKAASESRSAPLLAIHRADMPFAVGLNYASPVSPRDAWSGWGRPSARRRGRCSGAGAPVPQVAMTGKSGGRRRSDGARGADGRRCRRKFARADGRTRRALRQRSGGGVATCCQPDTDGKLVVPSLI